MKQPRPKPHLIISEEPLKSGVTQIALCGAEIPNAEWAFMWDQETGQTISGRKSESFCYNQLIVCRKCQNLDNESKRYLYGAISGQEAKQEG